MRKSAFLLIGLIFVLSLIAIILIISRQRSQDNKPKDEAYESFIQLKSKAEKLINQGYLAEAINIYKQFPHQLLYNSEAGKEVQLEILRLELMIQQRLSDGLASLSNLLSQNKRVEAVKKIDEIYPYASEDTSQTLMRLKRTIMDELANDLKLDYFNYTRDLKKMFTQRQLDECYKMLREFLTAKRPEIESEILRLANLDYDSLIENLSRMQPEPIINQLEPIFTSQLDPIDLPVCKLILVDILTLSYIKNYVLNEKRIRTISDPTARELLLTAVGQLYLSDNPEDLVNARQNLERARQAGLQIARFYLFGLEDKRYK